MEMNAKKQDAAIAKIRAERGLSVRIAEALKIKKAAVYQWRRVPGTRVMRVAEIIDMPPEKIRPDIFRK
jgi:pyruvate kinase